MQWILSRTAASEVLKWTVVQELWNGYGELVRVHLGGGPLGSVILKRIVPPPDARETVSDIRKRRSYEVERSWYEHGAAMCDENCRVARCLGVCRFEDTTLLLLEDLCDSGFRPQPSPNPDQVRAGLKWLASFHARFLNDKPPGLWEQGSYWHFGTRQAEWERMPSGPLKEHAATLDRCLKSTRFRTLVHGDPKPPNFCWNRSGQAAAVDFQYVGGGCGIRDVALFLDRGVGRKRLRAEEGPWLDLYFSLLHQALGKGHPDFSALEEDWRSRFAVAWSDYARFCLGWARSYSLDTYSWELLERALTVACTA